MKPSGRSCQTESTSAPMTTREASAFMISPPGTRGKSSERTKTSQRACPFPPTTVTCFTPKWTNTTLTLCSSTISTRADKGPNYYLKSASNLRIGKILRVYRRETSVGHHFIPSSQGAASNQPISPTAVSGELPDYQLSAQSALPAPAAYALAWLSFFRDSGSSFRSAAPSNSWS